MHRSLLTTLMIDCLDESFDESLAFWSEALGLPPARRPAKGQRYVTLGRLPIPLKVCLQRVQDDPGFHLDIETDDMRAERERLTAFGAATKYRIHRWWVMEDPSGNAFCLVRPVDGAFERRARKWKP